MEEDGDGMGGVGASAAAQAVAASDLPVFCVSSTNAQNLEGRRGRNMDTSVFSRLEDTQMPALREHVHDIARRCGARRPVYHCVITISHM